MPRLVPLCLLLLATPAAAAEPAQAPVFVSEIGPVIGAHVGPGLVGVGGLPPALLM